MSRLHGDYPVIKCDQNPARRLPISCSEKALNGVALPPEKARCLLGIQSSGLDQSAFVLPSMISAAFSAIAMVAALVLPRTMEGMTDASATRNPSVPRTRRSESTTCPIAQVHDG